MGTLERPTEGVVAIAGNDTADLSDAEVSGLRAQTIGFVFQQFFLIDGMSALDNVANGLLYRGVDSTTRRRRAREGRWRASVSRTASRTTRTRSRAGEAARRDRCARWSAGLRSCSPTSRRATSTRTPATRSSTLLRDLGADGTTIVVVTHNPQIAEQMPRRVEIRDGMVAAPTRMPTRDRARPQPPVPARRLPRRHPSLRTRRTGPVLSASSVAIGVAAMVAVLDLGLSKADLISTLDRLGQHPPGHRRPGPLPRGRPAPGGGAEDDHANRPVSEALVGRNVSRPSCARTTARPANRGYLGAVVDPNLLNTLRAPQTGAFLNAATARYPSSCSARVRGATARDRPHRRPRLPRRPWFTVAGSSSRSSSHRPRHRARSIGLPVAQQLFGRRRLARDDHVAPPPRRHRRREQRAPATAGPQNPEEVQVSRPPDALPGPLGRQHLLPAHFLASGQPALLVGGIGIANMMVISVLERRSEIGLRRALGATKRHIWSSSSPVGPARLLRRPRRILVGVLVTAAYARRPGLRRSSSRLRDLRRPRRRAFLIGAPGLYPAVRAGAHVADRALRTV